MQDHEGMPEYHNSSTPASTALPKQGSKLNILLVTRGHPFNRDAFFDILRGWIVNVWTTSIGHDWM